MSRRYYGYDGEILKQVEKEFIQPDPPVIEETEPQKRNGIVKKNILLRIIPDPGGSVLGLVPENSEVEVLDEIKNFFKIRYKERIGFMPKDFLEEVS